MIWLAHAQRLSLAHLLVSGAIVGGLGKESVLAGSAGCCGHGDVVLL